MEINSKKSVGHFVNPSTEDWGKGGGVPKKGWRERKGRRVLSKTGGALGTVKRTVPERDNERKTNLPT